MAEQPLERAAQEALATASDAGVQLSPDMARRIAVAVLRSIADHPPKISVDALMEELPSPWEQEVCDIDAFSAMFRAAIVAVVQKEPR